MMNQVLIFFMVGTFIGFVSGDCEKPKQLKVTISYETELDLVTAFFTTQLNAQLFESFNKCGVLRWSFLPCSTSAMVNGKLLCRGGECQCAADRIQACAATLYTDQVQLGKFIMCYFASKNAKQCAADNGMCYTSIEECVNKGDGDKSCNAFFDKIINDYQTQYVPGIKFGTRYDGDKNVAAAADFKSVLCEQLRNNNLPCDVCSCNSG